MCEAGKSGPAAAERALNETPVQDQLRNTSPPTHASKTVMLLLGSTGLVADRQGLANTENGEVGRRGGATLRPNVGPVGGRRPREWKRACDVMPCVYCPFDVKRVRARKSLTRPTKVVCW